MTAMDWDGLSSFHPGRQLCIAHDYEYVTALGLLTQSFIFFDKPFLF